MLAMICSVTVFADVTSTSTSSAAAKAASGAIGSITTNSGNVAGTDLSNAVPNVNAPNLATTLTETCMGSTSAGAAGAGFGFSFGTTWRDSACIRRLDARQLSAFGDVATGREIMCDSELVREAAARAGRPCVADGGKPYGVAVASPVQEQIVPTAEAAAPVVNQQVRD